MKVNRENQDRISCSIAWELEMLVGPWYNRLGRDILRWKIETEITLKID